MWMLRLIANKLGLGVRCCYLLASEEYMCAYVEESVEVFGFGWREACMMASFIEFVSHMSDQWPNKHTSTLLWTGYHFRDF